MSCFTFKVSVTTASERDNKKWIKVEWLKCKNKGPNEMLKQRFIILGNYGKSDPPRQF